MSPSPLCLYTPWCCKILKPLRTDVTSIMLLTRSIAYFIGGIYELVQKKSQVPGSRSRNGLFYSEEQHQETYPGKRQTSQHHRGGVALTNTSTFTSFFL